MPDYQQYWTKVEHALPDKPEVIRMAALLKIDQDAVTGKCLRLWIWAEINTTDGNAAGVTTEFVDRLTGCPGFGKAMEAVRWVSFQNGSLQVMNFDRHMSKGAKQRALTNRRVANWRAGQQEPGNGAVTRDALPERTPEDRCSTPVGRSRARASARTRGDDGTTAKLAEPDEAAIATVAGLWNELCTPDLPAAEYRNDDRDARVLKFWAWIGGSVDAIRQLFAKVHASPKLHGKRDKQDRKTDRPSYRTTFQWVIAPENATRVLEGEFDISH